MRTSQEIQDEISALEHQAEQDFIKRTLRHTTMYEMMTPTQRKLRSKLFHKLYLALKSEGKL